MKTPTQYPSKEVTRPDDIYVTESLEVYPEQSSIYQDVAFSALDGERLNGICVTPHCELGKETRVQFLLFCPMIPLEQFTFSYLLHHGLSEEYISGEKEIEQGSKDMEIAKGLYGNIVKHYMSNRTYRYYFLLGNGDSIDHSFVDFQIAECVSTGACASLKKLAVLKSPFREDVPTRFGNFTSRIGTAAIPRSLREKIRDSCDIPVFVKIRMKKRS